jgi:hypothetical protein
MASGLRFLHRPAHGIGRLADVAAHAPEYRQLIILQGPGEMTHNATLMSVDLLVQRRLLRRECLIARTEMPDLLTDAGLKPRQLDHDGLPRIDRASLLRSEQRGILVWQRTCPLPCGTTPAFQ